MKDRLTRSETHLEMTEANPQSTLVESDKSGGSSGGHGSVAVDVPQKRRRHRDTTFFSQNDIALNITLEVVSTLCSAKSSAFVFS